MESVSVMDFAVVHHENTARIGVRVHQWNLEDTDEEMTSEREYGTHDIVDDEVKEAEAVK